MSVRTGQSEWATGCSVRYVFILEDRNVCYTRCDRKISDSNYICAENKPIENVRVSNKIRDII